MQTIIYKESVFIILQYRLIMNVNNYETLKLLSNGLFAVNKICNVTSAQVLEKLKEIVIKEVNSKYRPNPLRFGHGGTLDHTATGVLVVGTGLGCKILPQLLHGSKRYQVTGRLGIATDTFNESGAVIAKSNYEHITMAMLEEKLKKFQGKIMQTPPKYSALKQSGQRISDLTRAGIDVVMKPRPVTCYAVQCMDFSPPIFKLDITCGGGFYVRSLVHDLGIALQSCAHVTQLHRNQHGPFIESDMLDADDWSVENILNAIRRTREEYARFVKVERRHKQIGGWDDR